MIYISSVGFQFAQISQFFFFFLIYAKQLQTNQFLWKPWICSVDQYEKEIYFFKFLQLIMTRKLKGKQMRVVRKL